MITRIILFGHTGMLGNYILSYFKTTALILEIIDGFRVDKDNLSVTAMCELLSQKGIDKSTCVINCIGVIPQRSRDSEREYFLVNGLFPHILWEACQQYGARMIQPTTDCVFSGSSGRYTEDSFHDENETYGISKSLGEPVGCTVIRCSIIGEELRNKRSFIEFVKTGLGKIDGWNNHIWNGVTCLEYCKIIQRIIDTNSFWEGVRHIHSPYPVSKYQMACLVRDLFNPSLIVNQTSNTHTCDRTLSSNYDESKTFCIPDIPHQLVELKEYGEMRFRSDI